MIDRRHRPRLFALAAVVIAGFAALSLRIVALHTGSYAERMSSIIAGRRLEINLDAERGRIFDRNGNLLAIDVVKREVCADPSVVVNSGAVEEVASGLSEKLGVDAGVLVSRLDDPGRRFVYLGGYGAAVDMELADSIGKQRFPGVFLRDVFVRSYPRGSSMCHVIGFVNLERQGSAGIEQEWDERIRGVRGLLVSEVDGRRIEIYDRRSLDIRPRRGSDIRLTLDQSVQYMVERALAGAVREHDAAGAWSIVARVKTGEILAMAGTPAYDPNDFRTADPEHMRNRCIANIYEPGSTFKIAVIAAALDMGIVTPSEVFDCENGAWIYERRPLRDFTPHGKLSVADILKKSSNIGAAKIALLMGDDRIYQYLRSFGLGSATGVKLPGEEAGILRPVNQWTRLSPTRIAIGHEVAVTALQMLNVMCVIANDGIMMRPHVVQRVISADGTTVFEARPVAVGRPIRPETAALMRALLVRATEEGGTGRRARVEGYNVGGKTGTSQKAVPGGYSDFLNIASFVGFLPAENPELGIIVVVDEPKGSARTGGAVAAPVFKEIAEQAVRYLNIPPVPRQG